MHCQNKFKIKNLSGIPIEDLYNILAAQRSILNINAFNKQFNERKNIKNM